VAQVPLKFVVFVEKDAPDAVSGPEVWIGGGTFARTLSYLKHIERSAIGADFVTELLFMLRRVQTSP
jgi:hypothetical protein